MKKHVFKIIFVSFVIFSSCIYMRSFNYAEHKFEDLIYENQNEDMNNDIIIVGIDTHSVKQIGYWSWSRKNHAKLIQKIKNEDPYVIALDIMFAEKSPDAKGDKMLKDIISNTPNLCIPNYSAIIKNDAYGNLNIKAMNKCNYFWGNKDNDYYTNLVNDCDGIVREEVRQIQFDGKIIDSFAYGIYKNYLRQTNQQNLINKYENKPMHMKIDYRSYPGNFNYVSYYDVLSGKVDMSIFKDKVVIIGSYCENMYDSYYTSIHYKYKMYGVEVYANIVENYMNDLFKYKSSFWVNLSFLFVSAIVLYITFRYTNLFYSFLIVTIYTSCLIMLFIFLYDKGIIVKNFYILFYIFFTCLIMFIKEYMMQIFEKKRISEVFEKYVSYQVADKIIKDDKFSLDLGGVKREVTILFVDIRGFTQLSEQIPPETTVEILNEYLQMCEASIFKYGGTVDKFIGDGVMAVYNSPLDIENHQMRAIQSAIDMKQNTKSLNEKLKYKYNQNISFGIGINTGIVIAGNIGSKRRMNYTVIGDVVNTASRIEGSADAGQILISEYTYEKVKDDICVNFLGEIIFKGKENDTKIYEVIEVKE